MEANIRKAGPLQQDLQPAVRGARIGGLFRLQGVGEYPLSQCGLFSLTENCNCTARQYDLTSTGVGLGIPSSQPAAIFSVDGTADFQCTADLIEVLPLESTDLTPPQTGGQFRVEEVMPDFILHDDLHKHIQLIVCQDLFRSIAELGSDNLFGWIAGDQVSLLRRFQYAVERSVDAAHCTTGQTIAQRFVEPLDVFRCDSGQMFITQAGADVVLDVAAVVLQRVGPQCICRAPQPLVQPLREHHPALLCQVSTLVAVDVLAELCGQFLLRGSIDVPEDRVAVFLVAYHDAALPASVVTLAYHAVTRWSALRHELSPPCSHTPYHTLA